MARIDLKLWRLLDANFNRAKEGLRVCEDVCRFLFDEATVTRGYKRIRHQLAASAQELNVQALICARESVGDVGRRSSKSEFQRRTVKDIFYANSQRTKESLRVLEEFAKLVSPRVAEKMKRLRYAIYHLEKKVVMRF